MKKQPGENLAVAYGLKRRAKKMAKGGMVNESAKSESRPMPSEKDKDAKLVAENNHTKANAEDGMLDRPDLKQSRKGLKTMPIKHPRMVGSSVIQARLRAQEDDLMESEAPKHAQGGEIKQQSVNRPDKGYGAIIHKDRTKLFEGGVVSEHASEEDLVEHPAHLEEDDDQMRLPVDEYMAGRFAEGGIIDEDELEHESSLAAAIMAKRRRYAEGGEVDIEDNGQEEPNYFDDRNVAALKENYDSDMESVSQPMDSNEMADSREEEEENDHDSSVVGAIRRKMKSRSPISR